MHANPVTQSASSFVIGPEASVETIKLIRKLRWIGNYEEARVLEDQLNLLPPMARGSVLADSSSTD